MLTLSAFRNFYQETVETLLFKSYLILKYIALISVYKSISHVHYAIERYAGEPRSTSVPCLFNVRNYMLYKKKKPVSL